MLRWDTLGVVGFAALSSYGPSDWVAMYGYFSKPTVDFFGAQDGHSLQRSISLHYWNNVVAMIFDYLSSGGTRAGL